VLAAGGLTRSRRPPLKTSSLRKEKENIASEILKSQILQTFGKGTKRKITAIAQVRERIHARRSPA